MTTALVPRPIRGGAALFAFVFILLLGAAVAGYWFYILPGQQAPKDNANDAGGNANANRGNANASLSNNANRNAPPTNNDTGTGNLPEPPANNNDGNNPPPVNNDPDPQPPANDDAEALPIVKAAEVKARNKQWKDALRELRGLDRLTLSAELAERAARVRSRSNVMEDYDDVKSVRGNLDKDEPVAVKIFTTQGYQVIGSMYQTILDSIMQSSGAGKLTKMWRTFETSVSAREIKGEFMVVRSIGGYEAVPYADVSKVSPWKSEDLDEYYESRVQRARDSFAASQKTPVDKYLLACGLKKYAPEHGSHPWLEESSELLEAALEADPFLAESAGLERSRDYQEYLRMVQKDDSDADDKLQELLERYPNASQLADARAAGSAKQAAQAMAEAIQREGERGSRNSDKSDVELRGELRDALNASGDALITEAKKVIADAEKYDEMAMPGRPNFKENLDKALYYYHAARKILDKARDKGVQPDVCEKLQVAVNLRMFWCKKRKEL